MGFDRNFAFGKAGESDIANWLKSRGYSVLPVYEKEISEKKGPQLFTPSGQLIAPDLFAFGERSDKAWWIEAKHKSAFSWHRITERFVTGIDLRHYENYLMFSELSPWPIWLLFLHRAGRAKDTPPNRESPTGLFGRELWYLSKHENHRHKNWGNSGMVYWAHKTLILLASLDEVFQCSGNERHQ